MKYFLSLSLFKITKILEVLILFFDSSIICSNSSNVKDNDK